MKYIFGLFVGFSLFIGGVLEAQEMRAPLWAPSAAS